MIASQNTITAALTEAVRSCRARWPLRPLTSTFKAGADQIELTDTATSELLCQIEFTGEDIDNGLSAYALHFPEIEPTA